MYLYNNNIIKNKNKDDMRPIVAKLFESIDQNIQPRTLERETETEIDKKWNGKWYKTNI